MKPAGEPWLGPMGQVSSLLGGDPGREAPAPVKTEFSVPPGAPEVKIFFYRKRNRPRNREFLQDHAKKSKS